MFYELGHSSHFNSIDSLIFPLCKQQKNKDKTFINFGAEKMNVWLKEKRAWKA